MAITESGQIAPLDRALMGVRSLLGKNIKNVQAVLGGYMPPERFCGAVLTLCRHNPDLLKVESGSLMLAVLRVAQLQLSPDPALGQAWIIPRKGRAEFQLGWKGCLALAYRSPLVAAVRYGVVGQNDRFTWRDGRSWVLEHEPSEDGWPEVLDDVRAAWAIIELRTGAAIPRVMYLPEILHHKRHGQGAQPAWVTDGAAMALKTVIADACRRGPFEGEIGRAFALDFQGELGKGQPEDGETPLDVPFSVEGNGNGNGKASAADRFKAAHAAPAQLEAEAVPEPAGPDPEPLAEPEYSGGPINGFEPGEPWPGPFEEGEPDPPPFPFMRREQVDRIRNLAVDKGLSELQLQDLIGGRPEDQPASDETRILALLRDQRGKGKRR
jgi:recombination protein RecT